MRTAKLTTMEEFKELVDPIISDDMEFKSTGRITQDLNKVSFSLGNWTASKNNPFEDLPCGYRVLRNGLPVLFVNAAGDCDFAIAFILYWDGARVRGYIPKGGNTWDINTRSAFQSQYDGTDEPLTECPRKADFTEMENDIVNRITVKL